ncbi:MAG TPA: VOC family protein [Candidatus Baltobacteraceae bacterium]|jgi:predicted enzyme related to lactoylglutathione lyase|nr:VOC family protein [Candidatus Baltobacteraceae bacterium]
MLKNIAFVAYPSKNVQSTREWYERTLGMAFNMPVDEDGIEKYNEAPVGTGTFGLMTHEWIDRAPGSGTGVAFEVDDLDEALTQLRAKGIAVDDPYETPVCKVASFEDPEGNKITLHQITVPH